MFPSESIKSSDIFDVEGFAASTLRLDKSLCSVSISGSTTIVFEAVAPSVAVKPAAPSVEVEAAAPSVEVEPAASSVEVEQDAANSCIFLASCFISCGVKLCFRKE